MSMIRCCFEPIELPEFVDTMIQKCTAPSCKYGKKISQISKKEKSIKLQSYGI